MLKIDIDVIKCRNANVSASPLRSQIFENLGKMKVFKIFLNYLFHFSYCFRNSIFSEKHSTSPPCGNLVDGLPHDCHTETVAKPARLGPAKNDELVTKFGRVDKVLFDEVYEDSKKTSSSVF